MERVTGYVDKTKTTLIMLTEISIGREGSREAMEADVSAGPMEDLPRPVATMQVLASGLPQDLGKRSAFPTATLKTLRVSNSSHSLKLASGLSLQKKDRFSLDAEMEIVDTEGAILSGRFSSVPQWPLLGVR
jgi:hypothetical protein